ncbi:MAG: hypothetical protein QME94_10590, partial [Anaerolineae bacterium]|nr:hypothetical protein [Anaerolineae bacterium]
EDKIDELLYNRLGYQAIHFVVRDQSFADMVCEIQLRTLHQDLWAEASHRLQYKSEEHVPDDIKRRIYRLSAVLEVADVEFDTIKKAIDRLPGTEPLAVLNHLEHHYFRMIPGHHDRRLSLEVVTTLMPLLRELSADPKAFVDEFVARNDSDLRRIYHTYSEAKDELRRIFLFQPESTLIFACLEFDRHRTFALWEERFPRDLLADMAAIWGIRAPYDYTEE